MKMPWLLGTLLSFGLLCPVPAAAEAPPAALHEKEVRLSDLRQLTFGGENAEGYFSFDGKRLSLQATTDKDRCDQIYTIDLTPLISGDSGAAPVLRRLSDGRGRTTCSFFFPDGGRVLFSSTRHLGDACPKPPDRSRGYVWPLYHYQLYTARPDGSDLRRLSQSRGYDAEATICHDGTVVFTSDREGDLELYRMRLDGSGLVRLTYAPGYDGGAFFSEDCKRLIWRADRPRDEKELAEMKALLAERLVRPSRMELWTAEADGSGARPVTDLGGASFAPYFIPQRLQAGPRRRVVFSSNHLDPKRREFDLWAINDDGTDLERITYAAEFDGFPMFSPEGRTLVFASNRGGKARGETNLFLARWQDRPGEKVETRADRAARRIAWLAAPQREGRGVGSRGLAVAAEEIARWMKEAGLAPGAAGQSFFQPVDVFVGVRDAGSSFELRIGGRTQKLTAEQAMAAPMADSGPVVGAPIFCGYGVSAPEAGWDDIAGLELKGKVAVALRGVPEGRFSGGAARSYSDLRFKAWMLRERGARAVVFVDPERDGVPKLTLDGPEGGAGLPVLFLDRRQAALLVEGPDGAAVLKSAADKGEAAGVKLAGEIVGRVALRREQRKERNVIGVLRAASQPPRAAVVLGAHYDHLGLGGRGSFVPDERRVHPGADDNASGTTALLEAAERLRELGPHPIDVYFVAFTGEEVGLVGSSRFVKALPPGLSRKALAQGAMINFDMVGRLRSQKGATLPLLGVSGTESAKEWPELVGPACRAAGLDCKTGGDGYGPSDMTPFYSAGVPVLFFFTGPHSDYHRPSDTADKINSLGLVQVGHVAAAIVAALGSRAASGQALTFQKAARPAPRPGDGRGYGAYLGTIPDVAAMQGQKGGVRLSGARPQSPAEQAGVKEGDVLVGLGGKNVDTLEDMAYVLRTLKPGQKVDVVVLRHGKRLTLTATMGERPAAK